MRGKQRKAGEKNGRTARQEEEQALPSLPFATQASFLLERRRQAFLASVLTLSAALPAWSAAGALQLQQPASASALHELAAVDAAISSTAALRERERRQRARAALLSRLLEEKRALLSHHRRLLEAERTQTREDDEAWRAVAMQRQAEAEGRLQQRESSTQPQPQPLPPKASPPSALPALSDDGGRQVGRDGPSAAHSSAAASVLPRSSASVEASLPLTLQQQRGRRGEDEAEVRTAEQADTQDGRRPDALPAAAAACVAPPSQSLQPAAAPAAAQPEAHPAQVGAAESAKVSTTAAAPPAACLSHC